MKLDKLLFYLNFLVLLVLGAALIANYLYPEWLLYFYVSKGFVNLLIVYLISFLLLITILDKNLNLYWKFFCTLGCILISVEAFLMGKGMPLIYFISKWIKH